MAEKELYTIGEMAMMLGVHRATLHNYVHRGILKPDYVGPKYKDGRGGQRRFSKETIESFISKCTKGDFNGEYLLSCSEVCQYANLSRSGLRHHIYAGHLVPDVELPPFDNGKPGERRFKLETVLKFVEAHPKRGAKTA